MILIATDLDRTLLPNGDEKDDKSMEVFYREIKKINDMTLVYVTGRNLELFKKAKEEFPVEDPDYLIGSVGTEIFKNENGEMKVYENYLKYLKKEHSKWDRDQIISDIQQNSVIYLQEKEVQNYFKISYYTKDTNPSGKTVLNIKSYIEKININAEVVYSFDPIKKIGLIDILPVKATKKGALEFLINELDIKKEDAVFSGDSGNDLLVLSSGVRSILVKNSMDEVKKEAQKIAKEINIENKLYIAKGNDSLGGNYASGIIEGLQYFNII